eukprot:TRINITY_DN7231_c0_g2_i1.p1 TRINITY_DN7231_c0_g2~~TRINITY_DN7231_c0_g2_i1.p1  ORF type:complete len:496 (-),score=100.58 TRINITY_DN7231_c0_g2_i1:16-1503(-)
MGENVRIAIVDDGIQTNHPDIAPNAKIDSSWNFNQNVPSPDPVYLRNRWGDWHGTASAGTAAARDDGKVCGVGVAPRAELAGLAILQNNVDVGDSTEARALGFMPQKNHIYSNSWGPVSPGKDGHSLEGPGHLTRAVLSKMIKEGRGGLGSIYVWAAGNDAIENDQCNFDGYANMRYSILIGSSLGTGQPDYHSEPCAALMAVTPGGGLNSKIVTSDLLGVNGLNQKGDCTAFTGTSASCPMAAGVVALILSANPSLTWLEVQYVLREAAYKHIEHKSWIQNKAGIWHSVHFGFGLLDADRAVVAALQWKDQGLEVKEKTLILNSFTAKVMKNQSVGTSTLLVEDPQFTGLHHVEVWLWTTHQTISTTVVTITSPGGTSSVLAWEHEDRISRWDGWRLLSRSFWGENPVGQWTITVSDQTLETESILKWKLALYGNSSSSNFTTMEDVVDNLEILDLTFQEEAVKSDLVLFLFVVCVLVFLFRFFFLSKRKKPLK